MSLIGINPHRISILIVFLSTMVFTAVADTVPSWWNRKTQWHIGAEVSPGLVPQTNSFLRGYNNEDKRIDRGFSGDVKAGFSFNPQTREGILYPGLYQGLGAGVRSFFSNSLLGTPVALYVYQGFPIKHFTDRLWIGYEWEFGAAMGWKHYEKYVDEYNLSVSTPVTAYMGVGLKLYYSLSERCRLSAGIAASHYSNGNTAYPNGGLNSIGATLGVTYLLNREQAPTSADTRNIEDEADRHGWQYDITLFCSYRKRFIYFGDPVEPHLCPGKYGVLGMQFSPLYRLNRYVAIGPGLDAQWDESADLASYREEGYVDEDMRFYRPPFMKQISVGLSAHAELTMPIFSINGGVGYDIVSPKGDKRFYQSLTLKTFLTGNFYLNVGYSLRNFKDPRNLMLGVGVRIK